MSEKSRPTSYLCYHCMQWAATADFSSRCDQCGEYKCPHCGKCACNLTPGEARVMLAMILSYENFLEQAHLGSYNFDVHSQLANRVGFKPGPKLTK